MTEEQYINFLQQSIKNTQEILENQKKEKYWYFPIKREEVEKTLLEDKKLLLRFEEDRNYIYKIRENLKSQLTSLRKMKGE